MKKENRRDTRQLHLLINLKGYSDNNGFIFNENPIDTITVSEKLQIKNVTSFKDFKDFFKTPWIVYKNNRNWVPPFWTEYKSFFKRTNPFWKHAEGKLYVAYKNNEIVGRVAAIIDHLYCKTYNQQIGFFGFFECIEDFECAKALLKCAENWLISRKMEIMRGSIDGRIDIGCGFLKNNFDSRPCFLSPYSPHYYIKFVKQFGMKNERDLLLYYIDLKKPIPSKLKEKASKCESAGIKIRKFNRFRTGKELKWWTNFFLQTFKDHWGFIPVSTEEVRTRFGVKQMRWFIDSKLFLIAEFNNSPVAYIWSTPDYNQIFQNMNGRLGPYQFLQFYMKKNNIKIGKLPLIGIKKEFRNQNIGSYLNYLTLKEMKKRGYIGAEVGWIDEKNKVARSTISITGAKLHKRLTVFEKKLNSTV